MSKRFFRCSVCSDIHYGMSPPGICPTCGAKNAYCVVEREEAEAVQGFIGLDEIEKGVDDKRGVKGGLQ